MSVCLELEEKDLHKAQLGLGHSYSRSQVQYDINRQDKSIIQSIAVIDQVLLFLLFQIIIMNAYSLIKT
jgi:RNA processing factor Prp31